MSTTARLRGPQRARFRERAVITARVTLRARVASGRVDYKAGSRILVNDDAAGQSSILRTFYVCPEGIEQAINGLRSVRPVGPSFRSRR